MRATWLVDGLRNQGARIAVYSSNWASVGGELAACRCWFIHHTASGPSWDGKQDLDFIYSTGPLRPEYNCYIQRDGLITVGAGGRTNHGGKGGDYPVGHPDYKFRGRKSIPWIPYGSVNIYSVSCCMGNNGVGEPYTQAQMDAVLMFCRAVNAGAGCQNGNGLAHFEWTTRKIDPAGNSRWATGGNMWDMNAFRASVGASQPQPAPPQPWVPGQPGGWDEQVPRVGPFLIQGKGTDGSYPGAVYATDGIMMEYRWMPTGTALEGYRWWMKQAGYKAPELEPNAPVQGVDELAAFGVLIGPKPG